LVILPAIGPLTWTELSEALFPLIFVDRLVTASSALWLDERTGVDFEVVADCKLGMVGQKNNQNRKARCCIMEKRFDE